MGTLQVDGYGGYRVLADKGSVTLAFCWAHVRRRFFELAAAGPAPIAAEALARIAELYRIETEIRGQDADARRATRQEKTKPLLDAFEPWLRGKLLLISQKTRLAEAIRYALSRWDGLCRFLEDGRVEIDSNIVERSIRPIALTRKNALFAGSDVGAETWTVIASLIESYKLRPKIASRLTRFPAIARAAADLQVRSAVIDGEAVILDDRGRSSFAELQPLVGQNLFAACSDVESGSNPVRTRREGAGRTLLTGTLCTRSCAEPPSPPPIRNTGAWSTRS